MVIWKSRLFLLAAVSALAGCATAPGLDSAPLGLAQKLLSRSAGQPVLYVSETHTNAVYTFDPANIAAGPTGKITAGVNGPGALAVGPDNVLYVANTQDVALYKAGTTSPFKTIASNFGSPSRVAVAADNTLAIAYTKGLKSDGELVIYDKGSATPTREIRIPLIGKNLLLGVPGLEIDAADNVFLATARYAIGPGLVQKFAPGSTKGLVTGLQPSIGGGFDAAGNLYDGFGAAICAHVRTGKQCARTVTNGISDVAQFAVRPDGAMFVPNTDHYVDGNPTNGNLAAYAPGGSTPVATYASPTFVDPRGAALGTLP